MKKIALIILVSVLPSLATSETKVLVFEKLLVQYGGPETRVRCSKWASTTGVKCRGLKCGRTTWKTCVGHATDFLQHKHTAQIFAHDYSGNVNELRKYVSSCLNRNWKKGTSASQVSKFLKNCLTKKEGWGLSYSVSVRHDTSW